MLKPIGKLPLTVSTHALRDRPPKCIVQQKKPPLQERMQSDATLVLINRETIANARVDERFDGREPELRRERMAAYRRVADAADRVEQQQRIAQDLLAAVAAVRPSPPGAPLMAATGAHGSAPTIE